MMPWIAAGGERTALVRDAARDAAVAGLALAAATMAAGEALGLGSAFAARALLLFCAGLALLAPLLADGHPHGRFGAANRVTLARAAGVAVLAALATEPGAGVAAFAVTLGAIMAALDGVDGWLARRAGTASPFGARFDMETDAAFVLVLAVLAWRWDKAGAWVLAGGLLRHAFIAAGAALGWMRRPLPPSRRRQAVCVIQVVAMLVVLAPFVRPPWSAALAAASLAVLTTSFAVDTLWLARRARHRPGTGS